MTDALSYNEFQEKLKLLTEQAKLLRDHVSGNGTFWEARAFLALDSAIIQLDRVRAVE